MKLKDKKLTGEGFQLGAGAYPYVPLKSISLPERPPEGDEHTKLFFNPRFLESFDSEEMKELRESIQQLGLIHPLSVRLTTSDDTVTSVELISGERRYRCLSWLVENDVEVYDRDEGRHVPASKLYEKIPCVVHYDISDEEALRYAWDENGKAKPLTVAEEIALVERLIRMDFTSEKIAKITGQHLSWVSHTSNFRDKLPSAAFDMLMKGKLRRSVAVQILSYPEEDREVVFNAAIEVEKEATQKAIDEIEEEIEEIEETENLSQWEEEESLKEGDEEAAAKAKKEVEKAEKKKKTAISKKKKLEDKSGQISQGNLRAGAKKVKVNPKTPKQLSKNDFVDILSTVQSWIDSGEYIDDVYEQDVGQDILIAIRTTIECVSSGEYDPALIARKVMIGIGYWEDQDALDAVEADCGLSEDDYDDEDEESEEDDI